MANTFITVRPRDAHTLSVRYCAAERVFTMVEAPRRDIPTLEELGIGLVPYSPLGKGYLAGTIMENTKFDPGDNRGTFPRFSPEALKTNRGWVDIISTFATHEHGKSRSDRSRLADCTKAQKLLLKGEEETYTASSSD